MNGNKLKKIVLIFFMLSPLIVYFGLPAFAEFLWELEEARHRVTRGGMMNTGAVWLAWQTDQIGARSAGQDKIYRTEGHERVAYEDMVEMLEPYVRRASFSDRVVPRYDGWRNEFVYTMTPDFSSIAIFSPGRCGEFEIEPDSGAEYRIRGIDIFLEGFEHDHAWADGRLLWWEDYYCWVVPESHKGLKRPFMPPRFMPPRCLGSTGAAPVDR